MENECLELMLPMPVSVNAAFSGGVGRVSEGEDGKKRTFFSKRRKSVAYLNFISRAEVAIAAQKNRIPKWFEKARMFEAEYLFRFPIFQKDGELASMDAFNFEKALSDFLVASFDGFDDRRIVSGNVSKRPNSETRFKEDADAHGLSSRFPERDLKELFEYTNRGTCWVVVKLRPLSEDETAEWKES